jgi:Cellulase (glycosyl hydrolase family 5)
MLRLTSSALCLISVLWAGRVQAQSGRPTVPDSARLPDSARDIRGVSWSDPRDNYNHGSIVPSRLDATDSPDRAAEVASEYARFVIALDANVVRLGINPATLDDPAWWPTYERVIRTLAGHGLGVILCAWEQSPDVERHGRQQHNGRFGVGSVDSYAAMWKRVHEVFRDEKNVIGYELLNEPFGYDRKAPEVYVGDMRRLMAAIGDDLNGKHILVAGMGYADDVQAIKRFFPEPHVWFAYHVYPNWWGGEWRETAFPRERYAREMAKSLEGVEHRTVVTEFGCWGGAAYDYGKPASEQANLNARRHVAYLHGIADACESLGIGSIYWTANANRDEGERAYDLINREGQPFDVDRMQHISRAWRVKGQPATTPAD